ncbi:hypothetical protein ATL39_2959 [Sinobaca qinghaiensis]|uniref:Uncharacterized protein n=1 Tax=Sinobaca qinghaiensis TaxID=342944 RepID=A0A419UWN2_9BACL|nr:DUF6366 family protein [Sinobaca qinghaiensis]RKD69539.1 hypothetical protein ATL39_2959 [Sinobaca qinghaiensis]
MNLLEKRGTIGSKDKRKQADDKRLEEYKNNPGGNARDAFERSQTGGVSEVSNSMGPKGILLLIVVALILYVLFG